jgi:2-oxoglutarate dehydrogenase E2 component (dihydrolipoamide succinyltransferase)
MPAKIMVPELGESVLEATVGHWLKNEGEHVDVGEVLVSLETDKVDLEVGAERSGVLRKIEHHQGEDVKVGDVLGIIEEAPAEAAVSEAASKPPAKPVTAPMAKVPPSGAQPSGPTPPPAAAPAPASPAPDRAASAAIIPEAPATPSARRLAREREVDLREVTPSDGGGRVTREDVQSYLSEVPAAAQPKQTAPMQSSVAIPSRAPASAEPTPLRKPAVPAPVVIERREERVRMSRRRQTIARRLVEAQHTAAMLTTFNEADMSAVMELRKRHKESFRERHGVGLGIASFFVKASIAALRAFPVLNAEIDGEEIVLKHYYDIGIAVGAAEGLVVPVLRDADRLSFAGIEQGIKDFARKAADRTLSLDDLRGGTFTITNGGVFGSLVSTPILNPPQVGILGLHKVQERPVSLGGEILSRPMMYLALSYDHRVVDGRGAVQFLVSVKELIEDPASLLLEA